MKYDKFIKDHLENNPNFVKDCIPFIQNHLKTISDLSELAHKLGYKNKAIAIGAERLKIMIDEPLLGLDDVNSYFDGTHGAKSLIDALLYEVYPAEESRCKAKKMIDLIITKLNQYTAYIITNKSDGKQKRIVSGTEHRLTFESVCYGSNRSAWHNENE